MGLSLQKLAVHETTRLLLEGSRERIWEKLFPPSSLAHLLRGGPAIEQSSSLLAFGS